MSVLHHEVVRVPEVSKSEAEMYALASTADGIATVAESDRLAVAVRETQTRQGYQMVDDGVVENTSSPKANGATGHRGEPAHASVDRSLLAGRGRFVLVAHTAAAPAGTAIGAPPPLIPADP